MINQKSIDAVSRSLFKEQFRKPLYESYSFSRVPGTIKNLLTGSGGPRLPSETTKEKEYEHLILFFIDGFGWSFFERYSERYPFLRRFIDRGIVNQLTAQFPSTTAAHVTCMNTGETPGESGVYEWFYYEPKVDRIIAPLLFSYGGDKKPGTLKGAGIKAEDLYPTHTIYQELKKESVSSFVFLEESIIGSTYSRAMFQGAEPLSYTHLKQGLTKLRALQKKQKGEKSYFYFYFANIDSAGHHHGIDSPQFIAEIDSCFKALEEQFYAFQQEDKQTACLLIADHGMIAVNPEETLYLNSAYPEYLKWFKRNRNEEIIAPAGSCRDFFLHIKEAYRKEAKEQLSEILKKRAIVCEIEELIEEGFFGETAPSKTFLDRVGNLVILPFKNQTIWWHELHRYGFHFHAMHGGLTAEEMEIPFLFLEI